MDSTLISNWNRIVSKGDTVYYLGDLAFGRGSKHYVEEANQILNGKITFIRGNHYDPPDAIAGPLEIKYSGRRFILSHWPEDVPPPSPSFTSDSDTWLIHGHHHNNHPDVFPFINRQRKTINVSVEVIGYKPVEISQICKFLDDGVKWMDTIESTRLP